MEIAALWGSIGKKKLCLVDEEMEDVLTANQEIKKKKTKRADLGNTKIAEGVGANHSWPLNDK